MTRLPRSLNRPLTRRAFAKAGLGAASLALLARGAEAQSALGPSTMPLPSHWVETPFFQKMVDAGKLPPIAERVPKQPLVADLKARGREIGKQGGEVITLAARARDLRYFSAIAYNRLVGYDEKLVLRPDILESVDNQDDRVITLHLRRGHRWSDGHPFTAEDFRYWWEDAALNKALFPAGPPIFMMIDGQLPTFTVIDEVTVRYEWPRSNPRFLPTLALPRDPMIYRPAHYMKQFHTKYSDGEALAQAAARAKLKSWAALHNRMDDMFENSNPDIPTLGPWKIMNASPATRFVFERNPYYHRVDEAGQQLPYTDKVIVDIASAGLFPAKANAGEVDFLARGLSMPDIPVLKEGEKAQGYRTLLWPIARGSQVALYPNLTVADPVWRKLNRDVRFRRALSLGIDRHTINNAIFFGLGQEGNNTVREGSAMFEPDFRTRYGIYDPEAANALLDEIGLTERRGDGTRLLSDGRPVEIVVEVDGEGGMTVDTLQLLVEFWREIGVGLFIKPQDINVLRNRAYAGLPVMVAGFGIDNAIPTAEMLPSELAPIFQDNFAWPKWGQYIETKGKNGEACDVKEAKRLLELYESWLSTADEGEQAKIWKEMLSNHADQQWSIGTVADALQPIILREGLKNFPTKAVYSWDPTSLVGIYRVDEMYWDKAERRVAQAL
ncbi:MULTISPECIES: ABC transporter substrate-binding protein [unclassified Chelatococcus]|uniref:ABC transporter substrate-binding protein n=1 Tax=unclassified Chelatococcus TaxID=2638111 RepID=UPI0020C0A500|nr:MULTISPECIES: ABC transporter substrate-binding protein [unclassified Chelatococcus]MCO5076094.1 ABC transporter substrate-binding protein [Chelatococcus sp.]CAH1669163.1 Peptide/nickel transport system substrate-binding protein [Hyphomicrobiales bacterium]CAH1679380.1 Peptide/nickel transport system substrate-binding protein [Hyphomicrobiales bacterium]